jgi:hypothetical protein
MGKVRKNFFIGVRTRSTLARDHLWNSMHRLAARTWIVYKRFERRGEV